MPRKFTYDEAVDAFWAKVDKTSGCWLWTGATGRGYGRVRWNGRNQQAHRVALELAGVDIPDGHEPDHTCDNRACVRFGPGHVQVVTEVVNRGRSGNQYGRDTCKNGHPFDRVWMQNGKPVRRCSQCNKRSKSG